MPTKVTEVLLQQLMNVAIESQVDILINFQQNHSEQYYQVSDCLFFICHGKDFNTIYRNDSIVNAVEYEVLASVSSKLLLFWSNIRGFVIFCRFVMINRFATSASADCVST